MTIKKANLEIFFTVLRGTDGVLSLADARIRDAFMKVLAPSVDAMFEDRKKIYEKFCKRKEDGTPDMDDGKYHFEVDQIETINKEMGVLNEEAVEIAYPWGVTSSKLKQIMDKSDYKPKYGEVELIDAVIATLEDTPIKNKKGK